MHSLLTLFGDLAKKEQARKYYAAQLDHSRAQFCHPYAAKIVFDFKQRCACWVGSDVLFWSHELGRFLHMYEESCMGNVDCNQPIKEKCLSTLLICISIYLLKLSCHSLPKHFFASSDYFSPTMFIMYASSAFVFWQLITWSFLFTHTWKMTTVLHTLNVSAV